MELKDIGGLIEIVGPTSSGKTTVAVGCPIIETLKDVAYFTFDEKRLSLADDVGLYRSYYRIIANDLLSNPEMEMAEQFMRDVNELEGNGDKFKVAVLDSVGDWTRAFGTYFMKNFSNFKPTWRGGGSILELTKLSYAQRVAVALMAGLEDKLGVQAVFVVNHIKDEYESIPGKSLGVKTGRQIPESSRFLHQKATMRLWLEHNPKHACPIAIVLKPMEVSKFVKGKGIRPVSALPRKLSPEALPDWEKKDSITIWDIIEYYLKNPVGNRPLKDYEDLTEDEFALVSGAMTDAQVRMFEQNRLLALKGLEQKETDAIRELLEQGVPAPKIVSELRDEYPEISMPKVMAVKQEAG